MRSGQAMRRARRMGRWGGGGWDCGWGCCCGWGCGCGCGWVEGGEGEVERGGEVGGICFFFVFSFVGKSWDGLGWVGSVWGGCPRAGGSRMSGLLERRMEGR